MKSRSSLLAPAHQGGPGKRAVKRWWCVGVVCALHGIPTCISSAIKIHPTSHVTAEEYIQPSQVTENDL